MAEQSESAYTRRLSAQSPAAGRTETRGLARRAGERRHAALARDLPAMTARLEALVSGRVQGVGFRDWVRSRATSLGLAGTASNLPDGRVEVIAQGERLACESLLTALHGPHTPGAVDDVAATWADPDATLHGFRTA